MKLLSIAIPCYNSQDYMERCIQSLLPGGEDVEILVVDDGSQDMTPEIADAYAKRYPHIVKAIHQENGGHGEAVNAGIAHASGLFFKVVDSDDCVDADAYEKILNTLREIAGSDQTLDLLISNFVYEKQGAKQKKSDEIYFRACDRPDLFMDRRAPDAQRAVSADALGHLPDQAAARLRAASASAYVLCR